MGWNVAEELQTIFYHMIDVASVSVIMSCIKMDNLLQLCVIFGEGMK